MGTTWRESATGRRRRTKFLLEHNLVAVSGSLESARAVVLVWERIEPHDGAVGFVALGTSPERPDDAPAPDADPRPVARQAASQAYRTVTIEQETVRCAA